MSVAQSCLTLCDLMDCSPPGSSVHGTNQARILEWLPFPPPNVVNLNLLQNSLQFSHSVVSDSATPWTAARQASPSITNSQSLLKLMSTESVVPSNYLIFCCPLLFLPSIFPSIRWPKYWSFSFSISPSDEYSGLISFRIDWLDLLARVFSNTTVQKPQFFGAQLSL